jgi:hypothetical protein
MDPFGAAQAAGFIIRSCSRHAGLRLGVAAARAVERCSALPMSVSRGACFLPPKKF